MLRKLFGRQPKPFITVVSGLPRSGTSMMMKMLDAGGIPPIQDGVRTADDDNPKGYYEYERVKKLPKGDITWLAGAENKSVKVISALLQHLPAGYNYKVLFMRRPIDEVLASQAKMLVRRHEASSADDDKMRQLFADHLQQVAAWTNSQPHVAVIDVDYTRLAQNPMGQLPAINQFLGGTLDVAAMAAVADPTLYRNRSKKVRKLKS